MKAVMQLHNAVKRLDETFLPLLSQLVDLRELSKAQATGSVKARLVELVQVDFREYITELDSIVERLTFLNISLARLICAANKVLEDKP